MKKILVDCGSPIDLLYLLALLRLGYKPNNLCNLESMLIGFNRS